jgi:hypothetical protein
MDAFFRKSTRNHNTSSWRVCRGFHLQTRRQEGGGPKSVVCLLPGDQETDERLEQAASDDGGQRVRGSQPSHRAGQFACKNFAHEQRSAAAACLASADTEQSDEADAAPAAPAANDSDETAVRSYYLVSYYIVAGPGRLSHFLPHRARTPMAHLLTF